MISISSTAFQNGTIEEELAWHYIMLASRKAHELFESEEDYQKNSLMGFLYWHIGNDSNLLIVFYVQIMPDDFVMQLHRF